MICAKCGKELPDTAAFCANCGAPVATRAAVKPQVDSPVFGVDARADGSVPAAGARADGSVPAAGAKVGFAGLNPIFVVVMVVVTVLACVAIIVFVRPAVNGGVNTSESGKGQTSAQITQSSSAAVSEQAVSDSATRSVSGANPDVVSGAGSGIAESDSSSSSSSAASEAPAVPVTPDAPDAASYHVETSDFAFDIPEYWKGKVDWKTWEEGGYSHAVVFPKVSSGYVDGYYLVQLNSVDPSEPKVGGDYVSHRVASVEDAGKRVDVVSKNWPAYYADFFCSNPNYAGSSQENELMNALIDLCCGGKQLPDVREQARIASGPGEASKVYGAPDLDYLKAEFVPNVVIVSSQPDNPQSQAQDAKAAEPIDYSERAQEIARALFTNADDSGDRSGPMIATGSDAFGYIKPGSEASTNDQLERLNTEGYLVIADQTRLIDSDIGNRVYGVEVVYATRLNIDGTNRRINRAEIYMTLDEEGLVEQLSINDFR